MLVLYEPTVSSIVEASKVGGRKVMYTQLHYANIKNVSRDADRVVLVVEHVNALVKKALAVFGEKATLVVAKKRWYADYIYRHLVEPRMKDELTKNNLDEYSLALKAEYRTVEMCRIVMSTITPRRVGDFAVAVVPRLPTGDLATLYYEKYRAPVFVASVRDTGIAWSAVADDGALAELANRFSRVGYVALKSAGTLSGFIDTYPEQPRVYLSLVDEVLQSVSAKPPESVKPTLAVEAMKTATSIYDYLRLKSKHMSWSASKTMIGNKTYMVVYCGQNSLHYASTADDTACTAVFYLPPPDRLAAVTHFVPATVRTARVEAKVSPVAVTPDSKYVSVVPESVVRELRFTLKRYGRAAMTIVG